MVKSWNSSVFGACLLEATLTCALSCSHWMPSAPRSSCARFLFSNSQLVVQIIKVPQPYVAAYLQPSFGWEGPEQWMCRGCRASPPFRSRWKPTVSLPLRRTDFPRLMQVWPRTATGDADGRGQRVSESTSALPWVPRGKPAHETKDGCSW